LVLLLIGHVSSAYALPEYARRTGEACATCHVNPGGGGPRTLRGMLWAAKGKPDVVPPLPGVLLAPGVTKGSELFEIACSTCHGLQGQGLFGLPLADSGLSADKIRSTVLSGRVKGGMPSFKGMFTDPQLQALVAYAVSLANGTAEPIQAEVPLPPAEFTCTPQSPSLSCGGN
jgi:mono/diheme cytochrome c family protein